MSESFCISAAWERLDLGSDEERACFAAIGIFCNGQCLTEGHDDFVGRIRNEPLLSAYHLAEWFAWNWWRLRWEPKSDSPGWSFAHRMATIGHGYVWPNVTIFSDGERTAAIAQPSRDREGAPFRYISDYVGIVPSRTFEFALDEFISRVVGQLAAEGIKDSNLNRIWSELSDERRSDDATRRRKLEALLGYDVEEADPTLIQRLIDDAQKIGERAIEELAADQSFRARPLTADELQRVAERNGFATRRRDAVEFIPGTPLPPAREVAPWKLGGEAAHLLRLQEGLNDNPITNQHLAAMAGVDQHALDDGNRGSDIAFALDSTETSGRTVLRSRWTAGRRFELARLLGERLVSPYDGKLRAATRAYTYRQQMQRAFAAEFLSPFSAVDNMLAGDYSSEALQDVAEHYNVSELTIRTLLVNHHRLEREELMEGAWSAAA